MSDNTTMLVNRNVVRKLLTDSPTFTKRPLDAILTAAIRQLDHISKLPGCNCKKGPKKRQVYDNVQEQLRTLSASDIAPLKAHLGATVLNFGKGHQI